MQGRLEFRDVSFAYDGRRAVLEGVSLAIEPGETIGIAGPSGGTPEKPVGTVFMAVADGHGSRTKRFQFHGDRGKIRIITAFTAMDWLRRVLLSAKRPAGE